MFCSINIIGHLLFSVLSGTIHSIKNVLMKKHLTQVSLLGGKNSVKNTIFPIHCSYICVRLTDGAARIYFSSLSSLSEQVTLWLRIIPKQ